MRPRESGRLSLTKVALAAMAAALLLTGALNLRSVPGGDDAAEWAVDPSAPSPIDLLAGAERVPSDLDRLILSYQGELRVNPGSGETATQLGHAYLQKARETGDPSYYPKAETLFTKALDVNDQNASAAVGMGSVALVRHDFAAALAWGQRASELNPYSSTPWGVIGDALIELGRYDEAIVAVQTMVDLRPDLASFARVSYLRELLGDVEGAIEAMEQASAAGSQRAENLAWTQAQLGNLLFNSGDLDGAKAKYEASLRTLDGYVYGLAGLARVAAAGGDLTGAIRLYGEAIRRMPLPEFVIALGELYEASGQPQLAAGQYALVEAMIVLYAENGVDTGLELSLFLADHGDPADLEAAVAMARAGYAVRPGIKAAEVLAWTLYKAGEHEEAAKYIQQALRLGTKDATLRFRAGMIAAATGDIVSAATYLTEALAINPRFSPLYAPIAAETLATSGDGP